LTSPDGRGRSSTAGLLHLDRRELELVDQSRLEALARDVLRG
jgi:hypothetical protein